MSFATATTVPPELRPVLATGAPHQECHLECRQPLHVRVVEQLIIRGIHEEPQTPRLASCKMQRTLAKQVPLIHGGGVIFQEVFDLVSIVGQDGQAQWATSICYVKPLARLSAIAELHRYLPRWWGNS